MASVPPPSSLKTAAPPVIPCFPPCIPSDVITSCLQYLPDIDLNYLAFKNVHWPQITVIQTNKRKNALDLVKNEIKAAYTWIETATDTLNETQRVVKDALQRLEEQRETVLPDDIAQHKIQLLTIKRELLKICKDLPQDAINRFSDSNLKCLLIFQRTFNDAVQRNEDSTKLAEPILKLIETNEFELALDLFRRSPTNHQNDIDRLLHTHVTTMIDQVFAIPPLDQTQSNKMARQQIATHFLIDKWTQLELVLSRVLDALDIKNTGFELFLLKQYFIDKSHKILNLFLENIENRKRALKTNINQTNLSPEELVQYQYENDQFHAYEVYYEGIYKILKKIDGDPYEHRCRGSLRAIVNFFCDNDNLEKALEVAQNIKPPHILEFIRISDYILEHENALPRLLTWVLSPAANDFCRSEVAYFLSNQTKFNEALQITHAIGDKSLKEKTLATVIKFYLKNNQLNQARELFNTLEGQISKNIALGYFIDHFLGLEPPDLAQADQAAHSIVLLTNSDEFSLLNVIRAYLRIDDFTNGKRLSAKLQGINSKEIIWEEFVDAYLKKGLFEQAEEAALLIPTDERKWECLHKIVSFLCLENRTLCLENRTPSHITHAERITGTITNEYLRNLSYSKIINYYLKQRDLTNVLRLLNLLTPSWQDIGYERVIINSFEAGHPEDALHLLNQVREPNTKNRAIEKLIEAYIKLKNFIEARKLVDLTENTYYKGRVLGHILKGLLTDSYDLTQALEIFLLLPSWVYIERPQIDLIIALPLGPDKDKLLKAAIERLETHPILQDAIPELRALLSSPSVPTPPVTEPPAISPEPFRPIVPPPVMPVSRPSLLRRLANKIMAFASLLFKALQFIVTPFRRLQFKV